MADAIAQATILVKKADGTTERVTLQEFKKRRAGTQNPEPPVVTSQPKRRAVPMIEELPSQPIQRRVVPMIDEIPAREVTKTEEPTVRNIPAVEKKSVTPAPPSVSTPHSVATTTPSIHVFEQPRASSKITDTRSLLDDDHAEIKELGLSHAPVTSVSFTSSVVIPKDLEARTSSLILSWKKGIRDKHQFLHYATKPAGEGGLGLSPVNAEKLFSEISHNAELRAAPQPVRPAPRTTPVSSGGYEYQKKSIPQQIPNPPSLIREVASTQQSDRVMGPSEEAAALTLEDFRRLSRDPRVAGSMLQAKFEGWKDESYLLYLQVRDSWKKSPLFRLYIEKTTEAIEKNLTIAGVLQSGQMTHDEYLAVTEVNRKIGQMD